MTQRPWSAPGWFLAMALPALLLASVPAPGGTGPQAVPEQRQGRREDLPAHPFLQIETGMHTATIGRLDTDAAGRFLVTGSNDKTVRVWDLASGQLLRTLRPPIGDGNEGQIFAVAISPDGELVAAGGWTRPVDMEENIYLFDRQSGRLLRRLSGLSDTVLDLAFSPDGSRLAATLSAGGLRVLSMPGGQEIRRDEKYKGGSYSVSFAADGRLVTTSEDGKIRLYDRDVHLVAKVSAPGGSEPFDAKFSPDGRRIAVGAYDRARVDVLDAAHLRRLYTQETRATGWDLGQVAWSLDGTFLYAAGRFNDGSGHYPIRRWAEAGRGVFQDLEGPAETVMDLRTLPDGRLAFASGEPSWGVLDAAGKRVLGQGSGIADFRGLSDSFRASPDGAVLRFAYDGSGQRPALFSVPERRLALDPPEDPRLSPPRTSSRRLRVTDWEGLDEPRLAGRRLALDTDETARNLAIAPDDQSFLLGTDWFVRSFDRTGRERWVVPAPDVVWAVDLTEDGRLAIAAFGDGTIRWYRANDGTELLSLFLHPDGTRWVLWTPGGYYDASAGGEDLIGHHTNRGPDQEAVFSSASHFRDRLRHPKVIDLILQTLDEAEALRRAGIQPERISE